MQINTPKDFVVLEDAVPAGFVVINPNLGSGSTVITERFGADQDAYYQKRWIAHSEYHANRVQAFGRDLQPGKYTLTYYVRAAYAGTFTLRSAMAQEMYAPEIEGRSAMGSITVRP